MSVAAGPAIVLLRSNDICFLGALRGLSNAGALVVPVVFDYPGAPPWFSEHSRHFHAPVLSPNPVEDEAGAVAVLEDLGAQLRSETGGRVMIVPSSDTNLMLLARHWDRLGPFYRVLGDANFDRLRMDCIDKGQCASLLDTGGVPTPVTVSCGRAEDIPHAVARVPLPCVYKPAVKDLEQSFYRGHGGAKAVRCTGRAGLSVQLGMAVEAGHRLVVQEAIDFASAQEEIPVYVYADETHTIRMAVSAVKESIHPAPFGTASVLRLTHRPDLMRLADHVVKALRWRGLLMIEFIRDRKDGVWKVIEVNGRPWLLNDFFRQSGFDFLGMLVDDLRGDLVPGTDVILPPAWTPMSEPVQVDFLREAAGRSDADGIFDAQLFWQDLSAMPGRLSLTYDDPDDPGPGNAMRHLVQERYGFALPEMGQAEAA